MPNDTPALLAPNAPVSQDSEFDSLVSDPIAGKFIGTDPATPGEEEQLRQVVQGATEFIFGDNIASVIRAADTQGQLFEGVAEVAFQILNREKLKLEQNGEEPASSVFFSETGAVPIVIDALWQVARKAGLPGAEDQDQYAGAVVNVFKKIGEHIIEEGDEQAIEQAEALAAELAMEALPKGAPKKNPLAGGIESAVAEQV